MGPESPVTIIQEMGPAAPEKSEEKISFAIIKKKDEATVETVYKTLTTTDVSKLRIK